MAPQPIEVGARAPDSTPDVTGATTVATPRPRRSTRRASFVPAWFALPAALLFAALVVWPSIDGVVLAFHEWNGVDVERTFVGLANLVGAFTQEGARGAVVRTVVIALALVVTRNLFGMVLALALNTSLRSRTILRTVFFAPAVMSSVVLGYTYKYLFGSTGPLNETLRGLGVQSPPNWLGDPGLALWVIIFVISWQTVGSTMVIYLAGLQGVPKDVLEAAEIDGAGAWRRFFQVSLPFLAPAVTVNMVLTLITGLRVFDDVYVLTGGGPADQTQTISTLLVQEAFEFGDFGSAAALAVVLSLLIALLTSVQFAVLRRQRGLS